MSGSDGRYMSIDSGPSPVNIESRIVRANVPGRSISRSPAVTAKKLWPMKESRLALAQRFHVQLGSQFVELFEELAGDRHAGMPALVAALRAAIAGQADFIDAGQPLRLAKVADMAVDFRNESRRRHEAADIDDDQEMSGIGFAAVV